MTDGNILVTVPTGTADVSPIGFHIYASEFARYASKAHTELSGRFSPVPYYLYCRSLELVLKAFLLAKRVPTSDLKDPRRLGHDLSKVLKRAKALGLEQIVTISADWEAEVEKANEYYAKKGLEYCDVAAAVRGYPHLPALDVLSEIVNTLVKRLEQVCLSA